jgi:hypothetical protein
MILGITAVIKMKTLFLLAALSFTAVRPELQLAVERPNVPEHDQSMYWAYQVNDDNEKKLPTSFSLYLH